MAVAGFAAVAAGRVVLGISASEVNLPQGRRVTVIKVRRKRDAGPPSSSAGMRVPGFRSARGDTGQLAGVGGRRAAPLYRCPLRPRDAAPEAGRFSRAGLSIRVCFNVSPDQLAAILRHSTEEK